MAASMGANVDCKLIGEYVDEGEISGTATNLALGQVQRPRIVGDFLDICSTGDGAKEFKVILADKSVVSVRGHSLKHMPPSLPGDPGSYGIVERAVEGDILVALFKISDVVGVFCGQVQSS